MRCWPAPAAGSLHSVLLAALAIAAPARCHDIRVYSEFTRTDPRGNIVRADRGAALREILSPAIPRNAFSGFHVVVTGNAGDSFTLHVGQNPANAVQITLFRENYVRFANEWIPDGLTRVDLPYTSKLGSEIPGQTAQAFWMDLWVGQDAPVRRIKVEPDVFIDGRWIRYPMEVRVVEATAPSTPPAAVGPLPPVSAPSDASVRAVLCRSTAPKTAVAPVTIRAMIARDVGQDAAIAGGQQRLWQLSGAPPQPAWCSQYVPQTSGPEWFLRIRDSIYRASEH
ncbi:MAG TPA: hypothetical protein VFA28_12590 [Bryobacteraceae bacterium]|nr:hypothetical protein [Bryobacteraceae bacterium]